MNSFIYLQKNMVAWRPTKYTEDMIDKVEDYLAECVDEVYDYVKSETEWSRSRGRSREQKIKVKLPTIEWFALYLGVNKTSIYEWKEKNEEFSNALEKINQEQRKRLLDNGLNWTYNPMIAKLVLSANHGMKETTVQEQTGKDGWPIQVEISTMTDDELMDFIKSK